MMRKAIAVAVLLVAFGTFVSAQEEVPLVPKPPTAGQGKLLVADAVRTARSLTEVEGKITEIDEQFVVMQSSVAAHNSVHPSGTCEAPVGSNACDGWVAEGKELNATVKELIQQREKHRFRKAELRGYLNMRLVKMRMMAILDGLSEWEQEVVACSRLKKDADRGCLIAAWERHP